RARRPDHADVGEDGYPVAGTTRPGMVAGPRISRADRPGAPGAGDRLRCDEWSVPESAGAAGPGLWGVDAGGGCHSSQVGPAWGAGDGDVAAAPGGAALGQWRDKDGH